MDGKPKRSPRENPPPKSELSPQPVASEPEAAPLEAVHAPAETISAPAVVEPTAPPHQTAESAAKGPTFSVFAEPAGRASAALARSQSALVRGLGDLSTELSGIARSGVESAARRASEALAVKTFSDAINLQLGLARDSFEAFVSGSLRLSELGIEVVRKTAEPLLGELLASAPGPRVRPL